MITQETIKEQLSRRFVESIANRAGYICTKPDNDYGVDLDVAKCMERIEHGHKRIYNSGEMIQLQLKATCENSLIAVAPGVVRYDLEAKSFNDLVDRRNGLTPLYLVLFVLPDDVNEWLTVTTTELNLRRKAYLYRPDQGTQKTPNQNTTRIELTDAEVVGIDFISDCFAENYV